jgi:hypothetical protein
MGCRHKRGTGSNTRSRALVTGEDATISTLNNQLVTAFTAPHILATSLAMVAMMQPLVQKCGGAFNNQAINFGDNPSFQPDHNAFNQPKKDKRTFSQSFVVALASSPNSKPIGYQK